MEKTSTVDVFSNASSSPGRPILNLSNDLTWYIFRLNSVMVQDAKGRTTALHTLRRISHVCRNWRSLTLSSSSLWGRAIDLGLLRKQEWREEVMRRTGRSLLSVALRGDPEGVRGIEEAVVSLLDEHWSRIQSLDLDFRGPKWHLFKDKIWRIFQRPARFLETVRFSGPVIQSVGGVYTPVYTGSPPAFVVFANQAPSLRTFKAPNIKFDLGAPWLVHIRDLSLNVPVAIDKLLRALSQMPLMESLHDENAITRADMRAVWLPQVILPLLEVIDITPSWLSSTDISTYRDFLAQVTPAPGCRLSFSAGPGLWGSRTPFAAAPEILQMYSRYPDFADATEIYFSISRKSFELSARPTCKGRFYFKLQLTDLRSDPDSVNALLMILAALALPKVRKLTIGIQDVGMECFNLGIAQFILSVSSVELEVLQTCPRMLQSLLDLPVEILDRAFPALRTIRLSVSPGVATLLSARVFLARRMMMGKLSCNFFVPSLPTRICHGEPRRG